MTAVHWIHRLALWALLALVGATPLRAFELDYSPTNEPPGEIYFNGAAARTNGLFLLTPDVPWTNGSIVIDTLPKTPITGFTARFGLRMRNSGGTLADGVSFNFGPNIDNGDLPDEKGITNGLAVAFDTYRNTSPADPDWIPGIGIYWYGKLLRSINLNDTFNTLARQTNFNEVVITLAPPASGDPGGLSTLMFQFLGSAYTNTIPYTPGTNWRMILGGRTGQYHSEQAINHLHISGTASRLQVLSAYGGSQVSPPAGTQEVLSQTQFVLQAPQYVYLDRYRRELDPTPDNINSIAHYRARLADPPVTVNPAPGSTVVNGSSITVDSDTTVTWHWVLENLAEVNSGTAGVTNLSPTDITDPAHAVTLGRRYLSPGDTSFDSVVYQSVQAATQPVVRFGARGYVMENAPGSPERFLELSGEGDHLRADSGANPVLAPSTTTYSVEFWARRNLSSSTNDQVVLGLGSQDGAGKRLLAGFGGDGAFFASDGAVRVAALPQWTDDSWHHWTVVNQVLSNRVLIYRDGVLVQQGSAFGAFTGDGVAVIGAQAAGTNRAALYSGGVNNVRVWDQALDRPGIYKALSTAQLGQTNSHVLLEMPFDSAPTNTFNGVHVDHLTGPPGVINFNDLGSTYSVRDSYQTDNFNLPDPRLVPLKAPGQGTDAWHYRTRWSVPQGGRWLFSIASRGGAQLWIDGELRLEKPVGSVDSTNTMVNVTPGNHLVEVWMLDPGGTRTLSVTYSTSWPVSTQTLKPLPANQLFLTASDLLALDRLTLPSTEGRGLVFVAKGFGDLFPVYTSAATMQAAILPGFRFGLARDAGRTTVSIDPIGKAPLDDWRRVFWGWDKQFQFKLSVSCTDADGIGPVSQLPYFRGEVDEANVDGQTSPTSGTLGSGVVDVLEVWLKEGEPLTLGTIYRTADRRFTLSGISGNLNSFGEITLDMLDDGLHRDAAAREYGFPGVFSPGSLVFNYSRTIHRATLPIGTGLDVSTLAAINAQLVPPLPDGVVDLAISLAGPTASRNDSGADGTVHGGSGLDSIWDFVGHRWQATRPGVFTIPWPDRKGYTNTIEVSASFPNDTEVRSGFFGWEGANGLRLGNPSQNYRYTNAYPAVASAYPGAPGAHYTYAVSPNISRPYPADLDVAQDDGWFIKDLAYADRNSATFTKGRLYQETSAANRSVLVFTTRPTGVATGNLEQESVVVRVVQSTGTTNTASAVVSQRLGSADDRAGLGSGYITETVANYNAGVYNPAADVGSWGPIFPVNANVGTKPVWQLSVGWYYDVARLGLSGEPPARLPSVTTAYTIDYPDPATAPVIYISSQMGSEGVGQDIATNQPNYQLIFDPARHGSLTVYNQPDDTAAGYNPNEEHAFVAPSKAYALTGDPRFNRGQNAAFALQQRINIKDRSSSSYTSDPWVLVQYKDLTATNVNDTYRMAAYQVKDVRINATSQPFPALDPTTQTLFTSDGTPVVQPANPTYQFQYTAFAGDVVVPPYPLNLIIGNVALTNTVGGNLLPLDATLPPQRTLWQDRTGVHWVVSGGTHAEFFERYWYPLRSDFSMGSVVKSTGTPIAWAPPSSGQGVPDDFTASTALPVASIYTAQWRTGYPGLKRGETLTYPGGEYRSDHPSNPGLPGILSWASAELVFDSSTPSMLLTILTTNAPAAGVYPFTDLSTRVTRPLDRFAAPIANAQIPGDLQPSNPDNVMVVGSRWYFRNLTGSLSKRFYYDSLAGELVLRGRLNGLESGAPNLTQTPVQPYVLEPNVLTDADVTALQGLPDKPSNPWSSAINVLVAATQTPFTTASETGQGVVATSTQKAIRFYDRTDSDPDTAPSIIGGFTNGVGSVVPISSFGIGSALVSSPTSLEKEVSDPVYITVVENNDPKATGAVAVHILQLVSDRYRGSVQVITPQDAFSEKIDLRHTGDFGGNSAKIYYQWWVHEVTPLDQISSPDDTSVPTVGGWQIYQQGLGLNAITFSGRPDLTLADTFFFVRYGSSNELAQAVAGNDPSKRMIADSSWRLVSPVATNPDWSPKTNQPVPYQWAGAANSPQLQADGSRRFLPQLVMGWVKRVLDQINLYEARYSATFSGSAPATYSSLLQAAGAPYNGAVALNSDKDAIENVGLIQLYETVLQRAKDLTANNNNTAGTDQAVLLAATRLAFLYELLGSEAFTDAQNWVVPQSADDSTPLPSSLFAFKNAVANPLQEELALLRGTDFLKAYPVYNRLFWNYFKADGEAAYNANYNIQDANNDGLIDESDAALLYPMGHGDAWGHYLSSVKMHYELLRRPGYQWLARSELYSLLGNVLPVDYLDEKSLATAAGNRVRTGAALLKATYREAYVNDPDGQWQGYEDVAQPARAWGVSEWSRRVGQGAWFDWMTANAVTPAPPNNTEEGLDRIDRNATSAEVWSVAAGLAEVQLLVDQANRGVNPLGLDADTMAFQTDPYYNGISWDRGASPFRQSLDKARKAVASAQAAYEFASQADQQLRRLSDDTRSLQEEAIRQDLDYRNRLVVLLGTPYQGAIGAGKVFAEGYTGPDTLTYMYIDATSPGDITPSMQSGFTFESTLADIRTMSMGFDFYLPLGLGSSAFQPPNGKTLLNNFYLNNNEFGKVILDAPNRSIDPETGDTVIRTSLPLVETSDYAFKAPTDWGRRSSPGEVQVALNEMLAAQIDLDLAIEGYSDWLKSMQLLTYDTQQKLVSIQQQFEFTRYYEDLKLILEATQMGLEKIIAWGSKGQYPGKYYVTHQQKSLPNGKVEVIPKAVGAFNGMDLMGAVRGAIIAAQDVETKVNEWVLLGLEFLSAAAEFSSKSAEISEGTGKETIASYNEFLASLFELSKELKDQDAQISSLTAPLQRLNMAGDKVRTVIAEADRLQAERTALNLQIAAKAQRNRYADLVTRINRSEALRKYDQALDNAARHAWLTLKTYDYETSLSESHPASATGLLSALVKTRDVGSLSGILDRVERDYDVLQGQIGLNNSQGEANIVSLRTEMMRISPSSQSDARWREALSATRVADLRQVPEFRQFCRPFASSAKGPQPGLVIRFSTEITSGKNLFGQPLSGLDHAFSPANYGTKIRSFTAAFPGYDKDAAGGASQLSVSPRFYLVPVGLDRQYCSDTAEPTVHTWNVVSQRIPVPEILNASSLANPVYQPSMNGLDGAYAERIRFGDSRAFISDAGLTGVDDMTLSPLTPGWNSSSRLYGRSVWNTRWVLILAGATLSADPDAGLTRFIDTVTDIKLYLETYSNQGM